MIQLNVMAQHRLLKVLKHILNGCKFQLCSLGSFMYHFMKADFRSICFYFKSNFCSDTTVLPYLPCFSYHPSNSWVRECRYGGRLEQCVFCLVIWM